MRYLTSDEATWAEYKEEHEYEIMFNRDVQQIKKVGYGAFNMCSANGASRGRALKTSDFMRDIEFSPVKMTRDGISIEVPSDYYTKKGVLRKGKRAVVDRMFAEARG